MCRFFFYIDSELVEIWGLFGFGGGVLSFLFLLPSNSEVSLWFFFLRV